MTAPSSPSTSGTTRRRGRVATHDLETLLDLVGEVAQAAENAGEVALAARVSMPVFDRVKREVDIARGLSDPDADTERIPTADAVQRRFRDVAGRTVAWSDIVEQGLRAPKERTMWLAALGRNAARDDLTDELVAHALQRVAFERDARTLSPHQYAETQKALVAVDEALYGEDALLAKLLPTANQVLAYCGLQWDNALTLAGLDLRQTQTDKRALASRLGDTTAPGMSSAEVMAFYAALNGHWPSYAALLAFAASCRVRMQDTPAGVMKQLRIPAGELLEAEGLAPPGPPKALGRGKRLTYRYPVDGIPGAPRRNQLQTSPRLIELRREFAVLSLRMWLVERSNTGKRIRADYLAWRPGTGWTSASLFDQYGGFAALKREATAENAAARRAGSSDIAADILARAEAARGELRAIQTEGQAIQPDPVPFSEALGIVLAGPHATASPAKP